MDSEEINKLLNSLDSHEKLFKSYFTKMMSTGEAIYPVDLYALGVINRSLSLIYGFTTLIKSQNFIGASHLVRPYLDNYLRFYAVWLVNEPHEFVKKILSGKQIDKLKDRDNQLLKDWYLVKKATENFPWIEKVYKTTSGFIHLSSNHVFTSTKLKDISKREVEFAVSKFDKYVPEESIVEGINCMLTISDCIFKLFQGWIETKEIKG